MGVWGQGGVWMRVHVCVRVCAPLTCRSFDEGTVDFIGHSLALYSTDEY